MDLTPNDEQTVFQTATADWCRDNMPLEAARARPAGLWQQLEAMGWTGMTAPGMDLDHLAIAGRDRNAVLRVDPVHRIAVEESLHCPGKAPSAGTKTRSEEHTSELQSLMRISYAVFCLKKKQMTRENKSKP